MPITNKSDDQDNSFRNQNAFVDHQASISKLDNHHKTVHTHTSSLIKLPYLINDFNGLEAKMSPSPTIEVHGQAFNSEQAASSNSVASNRQVSEHDFSTQEMSNTNDLFQISDDEDLENIESVGKGEDDSLDTDFHVNMNYTITYN